MSKSLSAQLLADIQTQCTRLATCVEIKRRDGRVWRLTSHDADIVVADQIYRHDIPFSLSAIDTGSNLAVDNTEITLFADNENIILSEVKSGLYDYSEVIIFLVDYANPGHGRMTMRRGWFGDVARSENRVIRYTITGMLKVLDFEVGRIYQPSCDADLGDVRCMVAIDHSQIRSEYNPYHLGNWVYYYNPALYHAITVINPSFEVDGARTTAQPITGWTRSSDSYMEVRATSGAVGAFTPMDGSYMLIGSDDLGVAVIGLENYVYQDRDLVALGLDPDDIDDGQISLGYIVGLMQGFYLLDPVRIRIELIGADGVLIDAKDTDYIALDDFDSWRERGLVFPLRPGVRTARLYIYFRKDDGQVFNQAADRVRFFWWNHVTESPYSEVVHSVKRLGAFGEDALKLVTNSSFEPAGAVANANNPFIAGWVTGSGNWWQITSFAGGGGLANIHADFYLKGGNDGGAVQRTYTITQTKTLVADFGLDLARIVLGKLIGTAFIRVGWTDTTSAATVLIEFLNANNGTVGSTVLMNAQVNPGTTAVWGSASEEFVIPVTATQIRVTLRATSPVGSGAAGITFDNFQYKFYDAERARRGDPIFSKGLTATIFALTPGAYTIDNQLIWKTFGAFVKYDQVVAVPDLKVIRGTNIAGVLGDYETSAILWLSGDNAGLKNLVRTWDPVTKDLKLYFPPVFPVEVGDRFMYKRACGRRFTEDCVMQFGNGVNFRGFPHLPGRLEQE